MLNKKAIERSSKANAILLCLLPIIIVMLVVPCAGIAGKKPKTVAEIALYRGPDRKQILIEGAKKEGKWVIYNSFSWLTNVVSKEFAKKYPFLEIQVVRSRSARIVKRLTEETKAKHYIADNIECSFGNIRIMKETGLFSEYYTPEAAFYPDAVRVKGEKGGDYLVGTREMHYSLGFNTDMVSPADAPKTYEDLLDPRWKGKMSMVASTTGVMMIGLLQDEKGQAFIEKLSRQDVKIQNISSAALTTLIVAGEVPLSFTSGTSNIGLAREKGAPVAWHPLEPVLSSLCSVALTRNAPHPHAALLFIDYLLSKEGQQLYMKGRAASPRTDIGSLDKAFKKKYVDAEYAKYPIAEYEKKYAGWQNIIKDLFIKKR